MLKAFYFVWAAYWALYILLPVKSVYTMAFSALALQFSFVFLMSAGYFALSLVGNPSGTRVKFECVDLRKINLLINWALFFSFIGAIALIYDRVFVQGVSYANGIAVAREQWRQAGLSRNGGVSSIYSVVGNLLSGAYFISAVLVVFYGKEMNMGYKVKVILCVFFLLMINSFLSGGRSIVLLLAVFLLCPLSCFKGVSVAGVINKRVVRVFIYLLLALAFVYTMFVFYSRAEASGYSPIEYLKSFLPWLTLELTWEPDSVGALSQCWALLVLVGSYLVHSFSTTELIVHHGVGDGIAVFSYFSVILHKLGLIDSVEYASLYAGKFPSLPGALYYQFGLLGSFCLFFFIGCLGGLAKVLLIAKRTSFIFLFFYLSMFSVFIISPLLFSFDFMIFPFIWTSLFVCLFVVGFHTKLKIRGCF